MSSGIAQAQVRSEAQDTFVGLLLHPLITASVQPGLFRKALRHRTRLAEWTARLGYRLVYSGSVIRLHRDPSGPHLTAASPPLEPPGRRDLMLIAMVTAACEDSDGAATVQELSDDVRALSAGSTATVTPYDPDRRFERQAFVRALGELTRLGILTRRTSDEALLKQWEDEGTGVGGGFEIDSDALLQFADPHTVELALVRSQTEPAGADEADQVRMATRGQRMLRTLVEATAVLYADLHPADAEYARGQRSWLAGQATEMTGGTVEIREEGLLLRLPDDRTATAEATMVFPAASAPSWFALKLLDLAITTGPVPDRHGRVHLTTRQVDALAARLHTEHHKALTKALADSPTRIRAAAESLLAGLGLVRVDADGNWAVLPPAARYRDPKAVWAPVLDSDQNSEHDEEDA